MSFAEAALFMRNNEVAVRFSVVTRVLSFDKEFALVMSYGIVTLNGTIYQSLSGNSNDGHDGHEEVSNGVVASKCSTRIEMSHGHGVNHEGDEYAS